MLQLVILLKAINEIVLLSLIAQGLMHVFAGPQRERNILYSIFKAITTPIVKAIRSIAPKAVPDRHIGFIALFLLVLLEIILILAKSYHITQTS